MDNTHETLRYTVTEDQRDQRMKEISRTRTFRYFMEERPKEEFQQLLSEIDRIMRDGIPLFEFMQVGMEYRDMSGESDYRKVAVFCFAEALNETIQENRKRTKSLEETPQFVEAYDRVFEEIVDFLEGKSPSFPEESLRCLFLLTDEDIDTHRQGLTATRLIFDCLPFCTTDQQAEEIERLIKACMR